MSFERNMKEYAKLAVRLGVNVQAGQGLVISAPVDTAEFVRLMVDEAYEAGAKVVDIEWSDAHVNKARLQYSPMDELNTYAQWRIDSMMQRAQENYAFITILNPLPGLFDEVAAERQSASQRARSMALSEFMGMKMSDAVRWTGLAVANARWGRKVFPDLPEHEAVERLWETIFKITRVDQDVPLDAWRKHSEMLRERAAWLTERQFKKLHYTSPITDLTIELAPGHQWLGGGRHPVDGPENVPNLPTEEVFSAPMRDGVNGYVTSTKPLIYNDQFIDGIRLEFENGRIVKYEADTGFEALKSIIEADEGSHYLGELALVPHGSPISKSGLTFFETLYDENASCHLAIGAAYPTCLKGGSTMSKDERRAHGLNESMMHEDFMIGSGDLNIDAETVDGEIVPLFRNGEWA